MSNFTILNTSQNIESLIKKVNFMLLYQLVLLKDIL